MIVVALVVYLTGAFATLPFALEYRAPRLAIGTTLAWPIIATIYGVRAVLEAVADALEPTA